MFTVLHREVACGDTVVTVVYSWQESTVSNMLWFICYQEDYLSYVPMDLNYLYVLHTFGL